MRSLIVGFVMLVAAGCGPHVGAQGTDVGAACTANSQCSSTCLMGNDHYPGGMCTIVCTSDVQCPKGSVCVGGDKDPTGFCAVSCASPADCSAFGRGFTCDATNHVGVGGDTTVCRVP